MRKFLNKRFITQLFNSKEKIFLCFFIAFCLFASAKELIAFHDIQQDHFVNLAWSFIHGRLDLKQPVPYSSVLDSAVFNGKYYVYFGPIPALMLIPLVLFFKINMVSQQYIWIVLFPITVFLLYKIFIKLLENRINAVWMTLAFVFGTVFSFLVFVNITAYEAQTVGLFFMILSIFLYLYKRNWIWIGLSVGLAGAARFTLFPAVLFFVIQILLDQHTKKGKLLNIVDLCLPILNILIVLGIYNYLRFGNVFDTGYLYNPNLTNSPDYVEAISHGFFSLVHVPENIFFLIFRGPDPVRLNNVNYILKFPFFKANFWGMGIFYTSPFLWHLFASKQNKYTVASWITVIALLIPILMYFGVGLWQYGYRYSIDFMIFVFVILAASFKNGIPWSAKILIIYSIIFNFMYMGSIWDKYPLLN